jgi:hypothetical protein
MAERSSTGRRAGVCRVAEALDMCPPSASIKGVVPKQNQTLC